MLLQKKDYNHFTHDNSSAFNMFNYETIKPNELIISEKKSGEMK